LGIPCGAKIGRDFLDGGFCQGIESESPSSQSDALFGSCQLQPNSQRFLVEIDARDLLEESFAIPKLHDAGWLSPFSGEMLANGFDDHIFQMRETDPTDAVSDSP
jgi:hypothetical protein